MFFPEGSVYNGKGLCIPSYEAKKNPSIGKLLAVHKLRFSRMRFGYHFNLHTQSDAYKLLTFALAKNKTD
jgi:hypothetical protein